MITMMTTKDDDKGDEQKAQRSKNNSSESKNISSESRTSQEFKNQEEFKTQEESLESRINIQDLKNQDQDSRMKKRLNQDKY